MGEILYGQDPTSPTFICTTLFNKMKGSNDPRLYRICRHYLNVMRSEINPDNLNIDLTDETLAYLAKIEKDDNPCNPGAAWWNNWVNGPSEDVVKTDFPTLYNLCQKYPEAGLLKNNFPARMMRPFLSIDFCQPDRPGILVTSAEMEFLLAEAVTLGWNVTGTSQSHFEEGVKASIKLLNVHYLGGDNIIEETEITDFVKGLVAAGSMF